MKLGSIAPLLLFVTACSDPGLPLDQAQPATGQALENYSSHITRAVGIGKNGDLVQRFCKNLSNAPCPPDIAEQLKKFGFADGGSAVELANAFALMAADAKDGSDDLTSSDEDYLAAAYRVALGRAPDEGGAMANLTFIKQGGDRRQMLGSLLESAEFKAQQ